MKSMTWATAIVLLSVPLYAADGAVLSVGSPLSKMCYESALAHDSRSQSIDGCTRALQEESLLRPDRAATYVNRGILRMIGGQWSAADIDFDAALRLDRNLPDGWLNKGFLRLRQGYGREALPLIQKGIDAGASRQALAYFARGVAYEQMGEYRSAYADLKRAQSLAPGWAMPRDYLASYRVENR